MKDLGHGANVDNMAKKFGKNENDIIDFSSNVNPHIISDLGKYVLEGLEKSRSYPDINYTNLRNNISDYIKVDSELIIPGNGATEIIYLLMKSIKRRLAILNPTFSEYGRGAKLNNLEIIDFHLKEENNFSIDLDEIQKNMDKFDSLFVCNPNNPNGKVKDLNELLDLMIENDKLLIVDETFMEFVYEDLGYKKEQILHATVHLDEETPHLHCVVVPLIKKFDKRTNTERYTISKKQYIKDKNHLSELQDKYHTRLVNKGYDLERGIKGSDTKHQKVKEFKKTTRYYEQKVNNLNCRLDNAINNFEDKMQTTKNIPFDKKHIILEKETFDSMNNIIKETKNIMNFQPKMEQLFNEVNTFTKSHKALEKENNNLQKEIKSLTTRNQNLKKENNNLKLYIESILNTTMILIQMMYTIYQKEQQRKMNYLIIQMYLIITEIIKYIIRIKMMISV